MKNLIITFITLLSYTIGNAQTTYTSPASGSGALTAYTTWSQTGPGGTPVNVIISNGYTVALSSTTTIAENIALVVNGGGLITMANQVILNLSANSSLQLMTSNSIIRTSTGNCEVRVGGNTISLTNGDKVGAASAYPGSGGWTNNTALPVTWNAFTITSTSTTKTVNWSTASELNNSHFEIERATGNGQFYTIGKVNGNGTTQTITNYTFADAEPLTSISYYRIKQIDYNGDFDYSKTIKVDGSNDAPIKVWPTVLKNNSSTLTINNVSENANFKMIDANGKIVNGLNSSISSSETVTLSLQNNYNNLSGFYFLFITDNNKTTSFKILVQ